jgi:hypothetical protein
MPAETRIFVSHSHQDAEWCREFVAALRTTGVDVWYDESSLDYSRLMDEIEKELRARSGFIAVLSPSAVALPWIRREMSAAMTLHDQQPERIVLPVVAETCDIPLLWSNYTWLSGPGNGGLPAFEAAKKVAEALGLPPPVIQRIQPWGERSLFASLARCCSAEGLAATRQLYDFALKHGTRLVWSTGPLPSVTARFNVGNAAMSVFSLYEDPPGKASFAVDFEYLKDKASTQELSQLANHPRTMPGVAAICVGLEGDQFKRRPPLSINQILAQPGAVDIAEQTLMELIQADQSK